MKPLVNHNRAKIKILKYVFLSMSCCVLLAIIVTLYLKNNTLNSNSEEPVGKTPKEKNYSLAINHSMFEGFTGSSAPYKILAKTVTKNQLNQYILGSVSGQCTLDNNDDITAKSINGTLDEENKLITLTNDVKIFLNNMVLNSEEVKFNLKNQDTYSDQYVEVNSEMGNIKANSFNTKESNNIIEFKGNVESTCIIKGAD